MRKKLDIKGKREVEVQNLVNNLISDLDNEKLYQNLFDNLSEGIQLINFDWKYLYANNAFAKQGNFHCKELKGQTLMDIFPGIEKTEMFAILSLCMNARISKKFEYEFVFPNGTKSWLEMSVQAVEAGLLILSTDISGKKNKEAEEKVPLKKLEDMLLKTQDKFQQPIRDILIIANLLIRTQPSKEELQTLAFHINQSALSLENFSNELGILVKPCGMKSLE
jgi:PAS domain S-box-containing protein